MHFFNPVPHMRLVEVVRGDQTTDQTVATVVEHAKRIGKMPIVVHDSPGFLVNRLLASYLNESLELLIAGATITGHRRAAERFGMPFGTVGSDRFGGRRHFVLRGADVVGGFPGPHRRVAGLAGIVP
jgi:3-hydroxyacyl-CoA dehydrogenase / enoyl-CoA hydratase / 3-hydroxybutyryl-CoA epimerase / enoyl-CoA isomerase